ncbi:MAG: class I adenylate-forming enzyme family protein [Planctomycetota bacterium JB042]
MPSPPSTLVELLAGNLPARAERPAIELGDEVVSYGALAERVERFAVRLAARGVGPGDRVGVQLPKSIEEVVAILAAARIGAVPALLHPAVPAADVLAFAHETGARLLVTDRRRAGTIRERAVGGPDLLAVDDAEDVRSHAPRLPPPPGPDDLAAIFRTSGTTGRPKGVMHSHRSLARFATNAAGLFGTRADDRLLGLLPLAFTYGFGQLTVAMAAGATLVLTPVGLPAEVVRTLADRRITVAATVASGWTGIVRVLEGRPASLPALRMITAAGDRLPEAVGRRLAALLPAVSIVPLYGTTETLRTTWLAPERFREKPGAIGHAVPDVEAEVVDPHTGRSCGPGEVGEIVHRGGHVMLGYWNDPAGTARRLVPAAAGEEERGPAFRTGDLGRIDEDGCLWFVARAEGTLKCGGFRVGIAEIERRVEACAGVDAAIAFGAEDEERGEAVHVAVTSGAAEARIDLDAVRRHCRRTMPSSMVPRSIHRWPGPFPTAASGKVDRRAVIEALGRPSRPLEGDQAEPIPS